VRITHSHTVPQLNHSITLHNTNLALRAFASSPISLSRNTHFAYPFSTSLISGLTTHPANPCSATHTPATIASAAARRWEMRRLCCRWESVVRRKRMHEGGKVVVKIMKLNTNYHISIQINIHICMRDVQKGVACGGTCWASYVQFIEY
jgi:hypothetical protein